MYGDLDGDIEAHGGRIGVEDSAYGGACFWFEVRALFDPVE